MPQKPKQLERKIEQTKNKYPLGNILAGCQYYSNTLCDHCRFRLDHNGMSMPKLSNFCFTKKLKYLLTPNRVSTLRF